MFLQNVLSCLQDCHNTEVHNMSNGGNLKLKELFLIQKGFDCKLGRPWT